LKAGGSGDSITAQEESLGKVPLGATRTRSTPSRNAVSRTFATPAVISMAVFQLFDALDLANMLPALRNSSSHTEGGGKQRNSDASSRPCHVHPPGK